MENLSLRKEYLEKIPDLKVEEDNGFVSAQVNGYNYNPYSPALSSKDIATIAAKICEDNPKHALLTLCATSDGAVFYFKQVST